MTIKEVLFTENSLNQIEEFLQNHKKGTEFGGALVGYQKGEVLIITHASSPGKSAKMTYSSIEFDKEHVTKFCNDINKKSDYMLYFLGDWHTHPSKNLNPSQKDIKAIKKLANYFPLEFRENILMVIVSQYDIKHLKTYILTSNKNLKETSHSTIVDPNWIEEFI
ncbi:Mov34/MPN/PAD-1 family protein [Jeotgalibacillus sp. JSM ZJ347]|uniref:Mov34/MPN/PAD-1 family protein n=1 Tax=Jeotgalibacillus sp. JSM ZJ347 TaxID=3342117 RepID=UPI0035A893BF